MKYSEIGVKDNGFVQKFEDYHPMHNGLLIEPHSIADLTKSGLYVPEHVKKQAEAMVEDDLAYRVLKVGPEVVNAIPGDYVLTGPERGYPVVVDTEEGKKMFYQIFENWVLGIFRPGASPEDFKPSPAKVDLSSKGLKTMS